MRPSILVDVIQDFERSVEDEVEQARREFITREFLNYCVASKHHLVYYVYHRYDDIITYDTVALGFTKAIISRSSTKTIDLLCDIASVDHMNVMIELAIQHENYEAIRIMTEKFTNWDDEYLLDKAIASENLNIIQIIIERINQDTIKEFGSLIGFKGDPVINYFLRFDCFPNCDMMSSLAMLGRLKKIKSITQEYGWDESEHKYSSLIVACEFGKTNLIEYYHQEYDIPIAVLQQIKQKNLPPNINKLVRQILAEKQIEVGDDHCNICYSTQQVWMYCDNHHKTCFHCYKNLIVKKCPFCRVDF